MAAFLGVFLLWLFATGEYKQWASLVSTLPNTGGATGTWAEAKTATANPTAPAPAQLMRTGADWLNALSGTVMADPTEAAPTSEVIDA